MKRQNAHCKVEPKTMTIRLEIYPFLHTPKRIFRIDPVDPTRTPLEPNTTKDHSVYWWANENLVQETRVSPIFASHRACHDSSCLIAFEIAVFGTTHVA